MSEPTPGPWVVDESVNVRTANHKERSRIKREEGRDVPAQLICRTAEVFMCRGEREANARLIALAPTLLELLTEARSCVPERSYNCISEGTCDCLSCRIEAAIAKATGEESVG